VCTFPGDRACGDGGRKRAVRRWSCDRPLPRKLNLGAQIPQVSVPEVREPQIRQLRSDLPQQLQITADAATLGDGERVLDGANMGVSAPVHGDPPCLSCTPGIAPV